MQRGTHLLNPLGADPVAKAAVRSQRTRATGLQATLEPLPVRLALVSLDVIRGELKA